MNEPEWNQSVCPTCGAELTEADQAAIEEYARSVQQRGTGFTDSDVGMSPAFSLACTHHVDVIVQATDAGYNFRLTGRPGLDR